MTRCSHTVRDHICTLYFLTPSFVPKVSPSLNLKLCFVLEGSRRVAIFGAGLVICFIADFSNSQFSIFTPSSHSPLLAKFLERSRNSLGRCLPNRPDFNQSQRSWNSMRWACATQPGLPALRNQFRLGISDHRSSLLFLDFRLSRRSPKVLGTIGPISNRMSRWCCHHTDQLPQRRRLDSGRCLRLSRSHF